MALSQHEIDDIVGYFTNRNAARQQVLHPAAPSSTFVSGGARPVAGGRGGGGGAIPASIQAASAAGKASQRARLTLPAQGGDNTGELVNNIVKGIPVVGSWLSGLLAPQKSTIAGDIMEPMDEADRPRNTSQAILNLLGTGTYAAANTAEEVGSHISQLQKAAGSGDRLAQGANFLGALFAAPVVGVGRGIAEGFGARFDHNGDGEADRPRTFQQNFEEIGANDAIRGAAKAAGATDDGSRFFDNPNTYVAGAGLAADIVADPLSWVTGTGLVKGIRGAAQAGGQAVRAGEGLAEAVQRAAVGGAQARRGYLNQLLDARVTKSTEKAQRRAARGTPGVTLDAQRAADDVARQAAGQNPTAEVPVPEAAPVAPGVDETLPGAPRTGPVAENVAETVESVADPRLAAVQALLPTLRTAGREVPAERILADAIPAGEAAKLTPETTGLIRAAVNDTTKLPELKTALAAVRATKDGKAFLATKTKFKGQDTTMGQVLEATATRRITGGMVGRGGKVGGAGRGEGVVEVGDEMARHNQALLAGFNKVLDRFSTPGRGTMTPQSLQDAIRAGLPDADDLPEDFSPLYERMVTAAPAERADILREVLGAGGTSFKTFDEAIAASVDGQVEASMMRSMLHALGVPTKAKTDGGLRKALSERGVMNWAKIQNSIPTPREVLDAHDIDAATEAAAKAVDPEAVAQSAADEVTETAAETAAIDTKYGVDFAAGTVDDALPNPRVGGGGTMRELAKLMGKVTPHTAEDAAAKVWYQPFATIVRHVSQHANTAKAGDGEGLRGIERGNYLYEGVGARLRQWEAYQRSLGSMPYLKRGRNKPLYVSFGQIYDALPEDVLKRSLFDLDYRKSKFGKGKTEKAQKKFHDTPLTVLPTTYGNGVWAALGKNPTVESIERGMLNGRIKSQRGSFEWSKDGEAAIHDIAVAMANPKFIDEMRDLHEAQEVVAVAFMHKAADDIIAPLAAKFIDAVATDADRSVVLAAIKAIKDEIPKISPDLDDSLVRAIVEQRAHNGILNAIGAAGLALVRKDTRAAARNGNKGVKEQLAKQAEVAKGKSTSKGAKTKETRVAGAQETRAYLDDTDTLVDDVLEEQIALGALEDTDIERIMTMAQYDNLNGKMSIFSKIGRAFAGDNGMEHLKVLQMNASSGSFNASDDYVATLRTFLVGGKIGRGVAFGGTRKWYTGVDVRLGDDLGLARKATDAEMNQHLGLWANTLAKHVDRLSELHGAPPSTEELRIALTAGSRNVEPLSDAQADMAMELKRLIDEVFSPIDGPLARSGVATVDATRELSRLGMDPAHLPKETDTLADNAGIWMTYDWAQIDAPLDVLSTWHRGISAAKVPQDIAADMSHLFDHRSGRLGKVMSPAEARKAGWKKVDPDSKDSYLAPFVDPDSYFPPELFNEMTHMDNFFRQMEKPINGKFLRTRVVPVVDFTVDILKSLNTVVNPSHHVGNMLGDSAMNLMDGISPFYTVRAQRVLAAGGKLSTVDDDLLSMMHSSFLQKVGGDAEFAQKITGKNAGSVRVNVGGKMVDISPEQLWQLAMQRGVAVTARQSKDRMPLNDIGSVTGRSWVRKTQRYNPYTHLDRFAGEFSATRDNFTRIAHFMGALEQGSYRSIDEAIEKASQRVHDFHPTIQGLSAFDQKYTRRVIFFHTWVRKAADIVVRTALEKPGVIAAPSKVQYNIAESQGFNPESFGAPAGDDPRIASYNKGTLLGPTFTGGYAPGSSPDELVDGEAPHLWGISLSMPQIDALQALFGGVPLGKGPAGAVQGGYEALLGNMNPILKAAVEIPTHSKIGGIGGDPNNDLGQYFASQTGLPYRLAGAVGLRQKRDLSKAKDDTERQLWQKENAGEQARALYNWLYGLKATDYTNSTSAGVAEREAGAWERKTLTDLGYDEAQIKEIRGLWKEQRLTP